LVSSAFDCECVFHGLVTLENDLFGFVTNGFTGQDKGQAVPSYAVGAGGEVFGLACLYVLGKQVTGAG
jgi:hypothetical protein